MARQFYGPGFKKSNMSKNSKFRIVQSLLRNPVRGREEGTPGLRSVFNLIMISLLFAGCKSNTPVSELNGIQVPQGFTIEPVVDSTLISYPMFASFDKRGRLFFM